MKNIDILAFEEAVLSSVAAPLDIFTRTNDILAMTGQPPVFNVTLVTPKAPTVPLSRAALFQCSHSIDDRPPASEGHRQRLILIPAFEGGWDQVRDNNRPVLEWLARHYKAGTEIASLCKGSYFLAEAGLLDDHPCTSHWAVIDDMCRRFPNIKLQPDSVVTDQGGLYTGGGAFSSLNLVLYLVEKFCGHEVGIQVAKNFSIQRDHINQAHFSIFSGMDRHDDETIRRAQHYIETHFGGNISVDGVASHVNMSKRNFVRRFKQTLQMTPLEYIQRVKIEAAKKALESGQKNIQLLTYEVGYNDTKTFRSTFKRLTGVTPQDYRHKYARRQIL